MPKRSLDEAADRINGGGVVAFPTETVYGLGARIDHIPALDRIFELKGRPGDNPLIVHISTLDMLCALTPWHDHPKVKALADVFWPGPLALVVPRHAIVPDRVTAGLDTVAIRMPNHPLALQLIEMTGPLAAPSANRSGRPSPTRAGHVIEDFGDELDVLDGGPCTVGLESTVLDLTSDQAVVLRPGGISSKHIEDVLGEAVTSDRNEGVLRSPGTRYRHYAPKTPVQLVLGDGPLAKLANALVISPDASPDLSVDGFYGYGGDYGLLASELYDRFRQADLEGRSVIMISPPRDRSHPMHAALDNRIRKAAEL
jgi:L-threonylcarbamoyladenylate synthase